jgi:hypothetical protein
MAPTKSVPRISNNTKQNKRTHPKTDYNKKEDKMSGDINKKRCMLEEYKKRQQKQKTISRHTYSLLTDNNPVLNLSNPLTHSKLCKNEIIECILNQSRNQNEDDDEDADYDYDTLAKPFLQIRIDSGVDGKQGSHTVLMDKKYITRDNSTFLYELYEEDSDEKEKKVIITQFCCKLQDYDLGCIRFALCMACLYIRTCFVDNIQDDTSNEKKWDKNQRLMNQDKFSGFSKEEEKELYECTTFKWNNRKRINSSTLSEFSRIEEKILHDCATFNIKTISILHIIADYLGINRLVRLCNLAILSAVHTFTKSTYDMNLPLITLLLKDDNISFPSLNNNNEGEGNDVESSATNNSIEQQSEILIKTSFAGEMLVSLFYSTREEIFDAGDFLDDLYKKIWYNRPRNRKTIDSKIKLIESRYILSEIELYNFINQDLMLQMVRLLPCPNILMCLLMLVYVSDENYNALNDKKLIMSFLFELDMFIDSLVINEINITKIYLNEFTSIDNYIYSYLLKLKYFIIHNKDKHCFPQHIRLIQERIQMILADDNTSLMNEDECSIPTEQEDVEENNRDLLEDQLDNCKWLETTKYSNKYEVDNAQHILETRRYERRIRKINRCNREDKRKKRKERMDTEMSLFARLEITKQGLTVNSYNILKKWNMIRNQNLDEILNSGISIDLMNYLIYDKKIHTTEPMCTNLNEWIKNHPLFWEGLILYKIKLFCFMMNITLCRFSTDHLNSLFSHITDHLKQVIIIKLIILSKFNIDSLDVIQSRLNCMNIDVYKAFEDERFESIFKDELLKNVNKTTHGLIVNNYSPLLLCQVRIPVIITDYIHLLKSKNHNETHLIDVLSKDGTTYRDFLGVTEENKKELLDLIVLRPNRNEIMGYLKFYFMDKDVVELFYPTSTTKNVYFFS